MTSARTTIRIPDELTDKLTARVNPASGGGISEALRESLSRYFELLSRGRNSIRDRFAVEELTNLCQLGNGTIHDVHMEGLRWNADDALPKEVPYPDDLQSLRDKLSTLTLHEHAALVDAVERYWRASGTGMTIDISRILD